MGAVNRTKVLNLPQWEGNEYFLREDMNGAFKSIDDAMAVIGFLENQPGNKVVSTVETAPETGFDTWTTIISKDGVELAREVDVESEEDGKAIWTSTITIGDKTVTVTDTETATGWTREVK